MANASDDEIGREEVAKILDINPRSVYNWEKAKKIPKGKVINRRKDKRWSRAAIEKIAAELPPLE